MIFDVHLVSSMNGSMIDVNISIFVIRISLILVSSKVVKFSNKMHIPLTSKFFANSPFSLQFSMFYQPSRKISSHFQMT